MNIFKPTVRALSVVAATFGLILSTVQDARAEMPQTDVALVQLMGAAPATKTVEALGLYYDLHVSELVVQSMNEQRTGAMFAIKRAKDDNQPQDVIAALEQQANVVVSERAEKVQHNQSLRMMLGKITGINFSEPLVMVPDAPQTMPSAAAHAPADLVATQQAAWAALQVAQQAWTQERLTLLEAQQRYDVSRDVPIGDHMRAMTVAETAYAQAIGACRLIEAKIAAALGLPLAEVLGAL